MTFIDTAELYGAGTGSNEKIVGRAVSGFRDEAVIATKFGFDLTDPARLGVALDSRPEHIREVAESKGIAVTQLALAWLLAQGDDIVPIPGTRSPQRLAENASAATVELTEADLARIQQILPAGAAGARYNEAMLPVWK